jgi:hypothetical protein
MSKIAVVAYGLGGKVPLPPEHPNAEQGWEWVEIESDEFQLHAPDSWTPSSTAIEVHIHGLRGPSITGELWVGGRQDSDRTYSYAFSGTEAERMTEGPVRWEESVQALCAELGFDPATTRANGTWGYPREAEAP